MTIGQWRGLKWTKKSIRFALSAGLAIRTYSVSLHILKLLWHTSPRHARFPAWTIQHVTWRIAFVFAGFLPSSLIAALVARIIRSTSRRRASSFTSSITGSALYFPEPTISRRHFQGISSSSESGVCPNCSRNFRETFFLRLRIFPRSITTSCSYASPSISIEPKANLPKSIAGHLLTSLCDCQCASSQIRADRPAILLRRCEGSATPAKPLGMSKVVMTPTSSRLSTTGSSFTSHSKNRRAASRKRGPRRNCNHLASHQQSDRGVTCRVVEGQIAIGHDTYDFATLHHPDPSNVIPGHQLACTSDTRIC